MRRSGQERGRGTLLGGVVVAGLAVLALTGGGVSPQGGAAGGMVPGHGGVGAVVARVAGEAYLLGPEGAELLAPGAPVPRAAWVEVGPGAGVELSLPDGGLAFLLGGARVQVAPEWDAPAGETRLRLHGGTLWARVGGQGTGAPVLAVETPAAVTRTGGAVLGIGVTAGGDTAVQVLAGQAEARSAGFLVHVGPGEAATARPGRKPERGVGLPLSGRGVPVPVRAWLEERGAGGAPADALRRASRTESGPDPG